MTVKMSLYLISTLYIYIHQMVTFRLNIYPQNMILRYVFLKMYLLSTRSQDILFLLPSVLELIS